MVVFHCSMEVVRIALKLAFPSSVFTTSFLHSPEFREVPSELSPMTVAELGSLRLRMALAVAAHLRSNTPIFANAVVIADMRPAAVAAEDPPLIV